MNSYEFFRESSLFKEEQNEFDFNLSSQQILPEVFDFEFMYTQVFMPIQDDMNGAEIHNDEEVNRDIQSKNKNLNLSFKDLKYLECRDICNKASAAEVIQPIKCSIIDNQLDDIFQSKKSKPNILANRRDVINKSILRGFKKFFVNLLSKQNTLKSSNSSKGSCLESRLYISQQAEKIGIMALKPKDSSLDEFEEFICWLGFAKITKKVRKMFSSENTAINLMEDIISNYSHHKLQSVLKNESIKSLFVYFICNGKANFMRSIEISKTYKLVNINLPKNTSKDSKWYEEAFQDLSNNLHQ